jgi:tetratricopeptide (TPR) repeat protein
LQAQGRWQAAFSRFQAALAAAPGHPAALAGLGSAALALGQVDLGLGWLRMAATADVNDAGLRIALGRGLAQAGRLGEAAAELRAALAQRPDADAARDLAAVLVRLGALDEAEQWFTTAALQSPGRADLHEAMARLQYQRDSMDLAVASHQRAAEIDPSLTRRLNIGFVRHRPGTSLPAAASRAAVRAGDSGADDDALRRACEDRSLLILDDFLDDPRAYRAQALALDYGAGQEVGPVNFPGAQTAAQASGAIMQRIADALGRDLKWDTPDQGAFRFSGAADTARCDIHVDSESRRDIYAAILYLSLPEHCAGGTGFWRHRPTGWARRPSPEELAAQGYKSFIDFERRWIPVGRQRPFAALREERAAAWDLVLEVPMRFNRLIVYRSDFFHAIGELFGDRAENARLVQLFYFESIGESISESVGGPRDR